MLSMSNTLASLLTKKTVKAPNINTIRLSIGSLTLLLIKSQVYFTLSRIAYHGAPLSQVS